MTLGIMCDRCRTLFAVGTEVRELQISVFDGEEHRDFETWHLCERCFEDFIIWMYPHIGNGTEGEKNDDR